MEKAKKIKKGGFTLIELIVVIVLLGILGIYVSMRSEITMQTSRISTIKSLASRVRLAADTAYQACLAQNIESSELQLIEIDGRQIEVFNGYPTASTNGIKQLLLDKDQKINGGQIKFEEIKDPGYSHTVMFEHIEANNQRACSVQYIYNPATSSHPEIEIEINSCE